MAPEEPLNLIVDLSVSVNVKRAWISSFACCSDFCDEIFEIGKVISGSKEVCFSA